MVIKPVIYTSTVNTGNGMSLPSSFYDIEEKRLCSLQKM